MQGLDGEGIDLDDPNRYAEWSSEALRELRLGEDIFGSDSDFERGQLIQNLDN